MHATSTRVIKTVNELELLSEMVVVNADVHSQNGTLTRAGSTVFVRYAAAVEMVLMAGNVITPNRQQDIQLSQLDLTVSE